MPGLVQCEEGTEWGWASGCEQPLPDLTAAGGTRPGVFAQSLGSCRPSKPPSTGLLLILEEQWVPKGGEDEEPTDQRHCASTDCAPQL